MGIVLIKNPAEPFPKGKFQLTFHVQDAEKLSATALCFAGVLCNFPMQSELEHLVSRRVALNPN